MVEDNHAKLKLSSSDIKKELKCEFLDSKLKECVDIDNFDQFSLDSSDITNKSILNCINSMIITCVGRDKLDINFSLIDTSITLKQDRNKKWRIDNIQLNLDPHFDDDQFLERLKNCLKFFNVTCIDLKSINFNITFSETNKALKHYQSELFKLKNELEEILGKELNV